MSVEPGTDLTENKLFPISWGIVYCVWCAPKSWTAEEVSNEVTRKDPPGTSVNRWVVCEPREREDAFNGVNQVPCNDDPDRVHWMLNC